MFPSVLKLMFSSNKPKLTRSRKFEYGVYFNLFFDAQPLTQPIAVGLLQRLFNLGGGSGRTSDKGAEADGRALLWYERFLGRDYGRLLVRADVQLLALALYAAYVALTLNGLNGLKVGFDVSAVKVDEEQ